MSYEQQQELWLESSQLKKGSKVRVIAGLVEEDWAEDLGWHDCFVDDMHKYVGQIGRISNINCYNGVRVKFRDGEAFNFPFFCLEPVDDDPQFTAALAAFQQTLQE